MFYAPHNSEEKTSPRASGKNRRYHMLVRDRAYQSLNQTKANFDAAYAHTDPREYFCVLGGLDYVIPDLARSIFRSVIEARTQALNRRVRVLDCGCSFGINPALIRFPIDIARLQSRYSDPQMHALASDDIVNLDRNYFRAWPERVTADFVGLDSSQCAIRYATEVGLITRGITSNLEETAPTDEEVLALRGIDVVISTGCVGYISERTFHRILTLQEPRRKPWIVNFVLRMFSFDDIAAELDLHGLITEKVEGVTFIQRRFHSQEEFESTLSALAARGIDPTGKEADGLLHAELFISRPPEDVLNYPLSDLVSIISGEGRPFGRRYRQVTPDDIKLLR